jgi:hypothetical protein
VTSPHLTDTTAFPRASHSRHRSRGSRSATRVVARALFKYSAGDDDCDYEDHRSDQEQSTDDLFVQRAAAMITARIIF